MKRVLIDVDDVITNQDGWLYVINDFLKTNYTVEDVKGYYIQDLVPIEMKNEFVKFFLTQNTYSHSKINDNCIEVIKKLNEKYEIYFCSSYVFRDSPENSGIFLMQKFDFLKNNFPFIDPSRFTFQSNKSLLNCDIKIDDIVRNLKNAEMKILYTAYHNKNISDEELKLKNIIRANNWKDIEKILL